MSKARKRRSGATSRGNSGQSQGSTTSRNAASQTSATSARASRTSRQQGTAVMSFTQNLLFSALVALGCWGMAFSFFFLYTADANHIAYGVLTSLMAFIWTFIFGLRLRKILQQRAQV